MTAKPSQAERKKTEPGQGYLDSREGVRSSHSDAIDALFEERDGPGLAGGVLAVIKDGGVVHQRGYGVANIENDVPFDGRTVLRLGSTTKHLCATCILILENRGKLSLADDVRRVIPELPDYGDVVRIRHLLNMTSGFPDGLNLPLLIGEPSAQPLLRSQILALQLRQTRLMFPPGAHCSYSNTNYNLLSLIIERIEDMTLVEFMKTELFEPLGMNSTRLVPFDHALIPRHATGYLEEEPGDVQIGRMPVELCGDGGVDSTLDDMLRWFENFRNDLLFGPDYRRRLETAGVLLDDTPTQYALGLTVSDHRGLRRVGHAGGMPGFLCDFVHYPQVDLGVVLLWNWMDVRVLESADAICDIVCADEIRAAGGEPGARLRVEASDPILAHVTGSYACVKSGYLVHFDRDESDVLCFIQGDATALVRVDDGKGIGKSEDRYRSAKVGHGFEIRILAGETENARPPIEIRFGAQDPMLFEPVTDESVELPDLPVYCGRYRSEVLGETCIIDCVEGKLQIEVASPLRELLWKDLLPIQQDLFAGLIPGTPNFTNVSLCFERDSAGRACAFEVRLSRVSGIRFERLPDESR